MTADGLSGAQVGQIDRILERLSKLTGQLGMGIGRQQALEIPRLFDQVTAYLRETPEDSSGARMVRAEFEAYSQALRKHLPAYLRELGGAGALEEERKRSPRTEYGWWWFPEEVITQDRKAGVLRLIRSGMILLAVFLAAYLVYRLWFQPDPKVLSAMETRAAATKLLAEENNPQAALQRIDMGLAEVPNEGELLSIRSALLLVLGRDAEAQAAFDEALAEVKDPLQVYGMRSQFLSLGGYPQLAEADAQAMIKENPNSAMAYMLLGQAYESQKRYMDAYNAYDISSTLGLEYDDPAIAAQSRIKMGMMMQSMQEPMLGEVSTQSPAVTP